MFKKYFFKFANGTQATISDVSMLAAVISALHMHGDIVEARLVTPLSFENVYRDTEDAADNEANPEQAADATVSYLSQAKQSRSPRNGNGVCYPI